MQANTAKVYRGIREREDLSPRVRHALKIYASGAMNKGDAARAMGLTGQYLSAVTSHNEEARRLINSVDNRIMDETVEMSVVLKELGRRALHKVATLMDNSGKDEVQLKAAQDLLDRNPETSKVQRHQAITPSIDPEAAKLLAAALVEGARVQEEHRALASGNVVHRGDQSLITDVEVIEVLPAQSSEQSS